MSSHSIRDTRHITLARALHARLYVNVEGRVFAARGQPAHAALAATLARHERRPTAAEAPTPRELGIAAYDGEIRPDLQHSIGRALHRWRKELTAERQLRPAQRRRTVDLLREHEEIERLELRLSAIRQWRAELQQGGEPQGAPYFLDAPAEAELHAALQDIAPRAPPLIQWHARVVYWLSGRCASRRYLAAVMSLLHAYPEVSRCGQVAGFQRAVLAWQRRSKQERISNLVAEIAQHVRRLPPDIVREGKFSSRVRVRTFHEHCDVLLDRCVQLLAGRALQRWHVVPAALAALAAADGSPVPLPQQCFKAGAEQENFAQLLRTIGKLAEQIGQPGYGALLQAIDHLPKPPGEFEYAQLRDLLARGNSVDDAAWACQHDLLYSLKGSCLSIPAARRLSEQFASRAWPLSADELGRLVDFIERPQQLKAVEAWLAWLGSVSPRTITPRLRKAMQPVFWKRFLPGALRQGWFPHFAPCLTPPRRSKEGDAAPLLERIAAYQQLAGKSVRTPKSLRTWLEQPERRAREREHLRVRLLEVGLDGSAQRRLAGLEQHDRAPLDAARFRRAAEEVLLLLGVEAQAAVARNLAAAKCREGLGKLVDAIAADKLWEFALWIDKMSEPERQRLDRLIAAHQQHGPAYKRFLPENAQWIAAALTHAVNIDHWFAPQPEMQMVAGRTMEIEVASDLQHVFLMGEYFHTCLGIGNVNEMSVLTNAYDANKQVVFLFERDDAGRRVVGRQLVAISKEFRLLGYNCYLHWRRAEAERRQEAIDAMAACCGRLAAQCGLELADQGEPAELGDHFWYDDGACQWPAAARAAWSSYRA
jgi:hypothetical protein